MKRERGAKGIGRASGGDWPALGPFQKGPKAPPTLPHAPCATSLRARFSRPASATCLAPAISHRPIPQHSLFMRDFSHRGDQWNTASRMAGSRWVARASCLRERVRRFCQRRVAMRRRSGSESLAMGRWKRRWLSALASARSCLSARISRKGRAH